MGFVFFIIFTLFFFHTAHQMPHCQHRMIEKHPRSRKPHDLPDLLPHLWLIAMHLTVCTECLLLHKRTFLASKLCVIGKFLTDRAHLSALTFFFGMIFPAVQLDHFFHNVLLSLTFLFHFVHVILHLPVFLFLFLLSRKNTIHGRSRPRSDRFCQSAHFSYIKILCP